MVEKSMPRLRMAHCQWWLEYSMRYSVPARFRLLSISESNDIAQDDISQLILLKRDFKSVNLVIHGGHGAALVRSHYPFVNLTTCLDRPTNCHRWPDNWQKQIYRLSSLETAVPRRVGRNKTSQLGLLSAKAPPRPL